MAIRQKSEIGRKSDGRAVSLDLMNSAGTTLSSENMTPTLAWPLTPAVC